MASLNVRPHRSHPSAMDNRRSSVRSTSPLVEGESSRNSSGDSAEVAEQPAESRVVVESNAGAMARGSHSTDVGRSEREGELAKICTPTAPRKQIPNR